MSEALTDRLHRHIQRKQLEALFNTIEGVSLLAFEESPAVWSALDDITRRVYSYDTLPSSDCHDRASEPQLRRWIEYCYSQAGLARECYLHLETYPLLLSHVRISSSSTWLADLWLAHDRYVTLISKDTQTYLAFFVTEVDDQAYWGVRGNIPPLSDQAEA